MKRGISLMEVLISIGIMAIGMVSIASLLPVGGRQVQRATTEERKAELGLNVVQEFKVKGFSDPTNWLGYSSGWTQYTPPVAPTWPDPICIDPMMLAANPSNVAVTSFPANATAGPTMKRVSLKQCASLSGTVYTLSKPLSELNCMMTNEIVVDRPDDKTLPGAGHMMLDSSSTPIKRDYEGNYTWLATITFAAGDSNGANTTNGGNNTAMLSIAICNARRTTLPAAGSGQEEMLAVDQPTGSPPPPSIAGAEVTVTATDAQAEILRAGKWVILCRKLQTTTSTDTSTFAWYRVTNASESSTAGKTDLTLTGPNWIWGDSTRPTYLAAIGDVVAVYSRSIHLEGVSVWNN